MSHSFKDNIVSWTLKLNNIMQTCCCKSDKLNYKTRFVLLSISVSVGLNSFGIKPYGLFFNTLKYIKLFWHRTQIKYKF